jgi:hypothetical protein
LIRTLRIASLHSYSRVAQVVEQVTVNHRVGGSSPSSGAVLKDHDGFNFVQTGTFERECPFCVFAEPVLDKSRANTHTATDNPRFLRDFAVIVKSCLQLNQDVC